MVKSPIEKPMGQRIKEMRLALEMTQAELAAAVGVSRVAVTNWESGQTEHLAGENLLKLAAALGCSPHYVQFGIADKRSLKGPPVEADNFLSPAHPPVSTVPVLSWATVGAKGRSAVNDKKEPRQEIGAAVATGVNAFALVVHGDAMEPRFPAGCVIVVDPARKRRSGDFVVVRAPSWPEAELKQLVIDAGKTMLKPLNERYRIGAAPRDMVILGVVVEKIIRELF